MTEVFTNANHVTCIFTEQGVVFTGAKQDAFYPYGCIHSLRMSLLGILQVVHRNQILTFAVDHKDRARMKDMIRRSKEALSAGAGGEPCVLEKGNLVSADLPKEEQLKKYKGLFVQGVISKDAYDLEKLVLNL